jgi:hypothetical protein
MHKSLGNKKKKGPGKSETFDGLIYSNSCDYMASSFLPLVSFTNLATNTKLIAAKVV